MMDAGLIQNTSSLGLPAAEFGVFALSQPLGLATVKYRIQKLSGIMFGVNCRVRLQYSKLITTK